MSIVVPLEGFGSGGARLNFKIVGGTVEPSNPSENMIWVDTDNKITSWVFSAKEPEVLSEGLVWIIIGTYSPAEFNALRKNGILVCPIAANQYIDGALVDVTAKSYIDGAWVDWIVYLFKSGETNPEDFQFAAYDNNSYYGTGSITSEKITASGRLFGFQKKEQFDLTGIHTLCFEVDCSQTTAGQFHLCASDSSLVDDFLSDLSAPAMIQPGGVGVETLRLDVSGLSGKHYIGGKTSYRNNSGGQTTIEVINIWTE